MIASAHPRFPGVQPHPHPRHTTGRPHLTPEPKLANASRLDRGNSAREDSNETVTLPAGCNHQPAMLLDHLGHKPTMPPQRLLHRVRLGLP
jgi:hypothetical protein